MMVFLIWTVLAVLVGIWASKWHQPGFAFALLAMGISPLLASLILLGMGKGRPKDPSTGLPVQAPATRKCPHCAELVLAEAKLCKHCHQPITPLTSSDSNLSA
jgi:hypothetical protein